MFAGYRSKGRDWLTVFRKKTRIKHMPDTVKMAIFKVYLIFFQISFSFHFYITFFLKLYFVYLKGMCGGGEFSIC